MSHRDDLARAFGLDAGDLDANRNGTLAPRQQRRLLASGRRNLAGAIVIGLMLAAVLAWIAPKPLNAIQVAVAAALFLAVLALGVHDLRRTHAAAHAGQVDCITGTISVTMRGKQGWFLRIGDWSARMPVRPWLLRNGAPYRVYVCPRAKRIVAMEPDGWQ